MKCVEKLKRAAFRSACSQRGHTEGTVRADLTAVEFGTVPEESATEVGLFAAELLDIPGHPVSPAVAVLRNVSLQTMLMPNEQ